MNKQLEGLPKSKKHSQSIKKNIPCWLISISDIKGTVDQGGENELPSAEIGGMCSKDTG